MNFGFGALGVELERGRSYLFTSKVLDAVNHSTIATFFDETMNELSEYSFRLSFPLCLCKL